MSAASTTTEVLVVGAGPTGLTLAVELARRGVSVRVVDRARGRPPMSRATDIHARTLELLAQHGVAQRLLDIGRRVSVFNAWEGARRALRLRLDALESRFPYTVAAMQNDTEALLEARLAELGVRVERGVRLTGSAPDAAGVTATLVDVAGARTERVRCEWLAGCDGLRSTTRALAAIPFEGTTYGAGYVVGDTALAWPLACDEVHLFTGPRGFANVVALPGDDGRGRVLCDLDPGDEEGDPSALLARRFAERTGGVGRATSVTSAARFRIERRLAARFRSGRVVLLGDAAHVCTPLLGQGMNLGIQDAFNLGWKLARALRAPAAAHLVDSYERERRPVCRATLWSTEALHRASSARALAPRAVVSAMNAAMGRLPPAQHAAALLCSELGTSYAGSPVVRDDDDGAGVRRHVRDALRWGGAGSDEPACGERAPDVVLDARGARLHERLDGRTLVMLLEREGEGDSLHRLADDVERRGDGEVACLVVSRRAAGTEAARARTLHDASGALLRRYGPPGAIYALRPDGYVGFRSRAGRREALSAYLALHGH